MSDDIGLRARAAGDETWFEDAWNRYMEILVGYCSSLARRRHADDRFHPPKLPGEFDSWVVTHNGNPIGFAVVGYAEEPGFVAKARELRDLWIDDDHRSQGVGRQAVSLVLAQYDAPQWEHFVFKANARSQSFVKETLKHLGGTIEGPIETVYDSGCPAVYWRHTLP